AGPAERLGRASAASFFLVICSDQPAHLPALRGNGMSTSGGTSKPSEHSRLLEDNSQYIHWEPGQLLSGICGSSSKPSRKRGPPGQVARFLGPLAGPKPGSPPPARKGKAPPPSELVPPDGLNRPAEESPAMEILLKSLGVARHAAAAPGLL